MKKNRNTFALGWIDFSLSAVASGLAVFSIGMGLRVIEISLFFWAFIIGGTLVSYFCSRFIPAKYTWISGALYSAMAIPCVIFSPALNSLLPKGGFPDQLTIAASLAWMLVFGSYLTWRDSVIVFQAVPSIALFGLVGAWDTFAGAPFAFFGFLLCFATLFARAHGRMMMSQAEFSGFSEGISRPTEDTQGWALFDALKRGPWRWMAGPEWAMGSAAVVILLSVLGAPVFQSSVQGVAGFVKIPVPSTATATAPLQSPFSQSQSGTTLVGQGPRGNLTKAEVFRVAVSYQTSARAVPAPYLRVRTYDLYTGRGWRPVPDFRGRREMERAQDDRDSLMNVGKFAIVPAQGINFDLELKKSPTDGVPIPGELEFMGDNHLFERRVDGTVKFSENARQRNRAFGSSRIAGSNDPPVHANAKALDRSYSMPGLTLTSSERLKSLAESMIQGAQTDYEKAMAIKRAIASRVTYNLQAPGVPSGNDPVEWFLFEGKSGYCDLFASSMTVLARHVGLPARYVTGYFPAQSEQDKDGRWILHDSEAHAWSEIFFEGHGWVVFDATEGAEDVGDPTAEVPIFEQDWFRGLLMVLGGAAIVGIPFGIAYWVRKQNPVSDPVRRQVGRLYHRMVRTLEKESGKPKRPSQTPQEYWATIESMLPAKAMPFGDLSRKFEAALFSNPATSEDVAQLRGELTSALKALKSK